MSEILQALEHNAQAQGTTDEAVPAVDMRSARVLPEMSGSTDSSTLPTATVTAHHIELGDSAGSMLQSTYALDLDNEEGHGVRDLLAQLLDYPGPRDGVVPDSWGTQQRSEFKRVSPSVDSIYTLNPAVESLIDSIREDFKKVLDSRQA
jgi:hypothetical protein